MKLYPSDEIAEVLDNSHPQVDEFIGDYRVIQVSEVDFAVQLYIHLYDEKRNVVYRFFQDHGWSSCVKIYPSPSFPYYSKRIFYHPKRGYSTDVGTSPINAKVSDLRLVFSDIEFESKLNVSVTKIGHLIVLELEY